MKFTTLAIAGSLISYATAYVNPINPWGDSKWIPGSKAIIEWDDANPDGPALSTNPIVDVFLMTGSDQVMVKLDTIATKINANTIRNLTYTVPTVDPIGKIYFIQVTSDAGVNAWTTRFTITDASGNPGTLAPTGVPGQNPGATGKIVSGGSSGATATPTGSASAATGSASASASGTAAATGSAANPTATAAGATDKNSASTISGSVVSAAAAVAVGVAALMAF
ncbi:hypothetical protein EC957_011654 [Mortierella hygrophila]|uniref:Yeast cell wall synthesis Kre9/Knh1-like N-terminal domain-containing protein n=1 Tax=Mortierella hygrophila TaxID=979708 RepID=A0A9P6F8D7_9FUNG|nr:hypothetical protein EC957_011654 [Mortierella hygrophila]